MFFKYLITFLVFLISLIYLKIFRENKQKVKLKIFNEEHEIKLGLLLFTTFLDGVILAVVIQYFFF